jgi:hypothetical protein
MAIIPRSLRPSKVIRLLPRSPQTDQKTDDKLAGPLEAYTCPKCKLIVTERRSTCPATKAIVEAVEEERGEDEHIHVNCPSPAAEEVGLRQRRHS